MTTPVDPSQNNPAGAVPAPQAPAMISIDPATLTNIVHQAVTQAVSQVQTLQTAPVPTPAPTPVVDPNAGPAIAPVVETITSVAAGPSPTVEAAVVDDSVDTAPAPTPSPASATLSAIADTASNVVTGVSNAAQAVAAGVVQDAKDAASAVSNTTSNVINAVEDNVSTLKDKVVSSVSSAEETIFNAVTGQDKPNATFNPNVIYDPFRMFHWLVIGGILYLAATLMLYWGGVDFQPHLQTAILKAGHVCTASFLGYWISRTSSRHRLTPDSEPHQHISRAIIMAAAIIAIALGA